MLPPDQQGRPGARAGVRSAAGRGARPVVAGDAASAAALPPRKHGQGRTLVGDVTDGDGRVRRFRLSRSDGGELQGEVEDMPTPMAEAEQTAPWSVQPRPSHGAW